jgi:hypothetical protein
MRKTMKMKMRKMRKKRTGTEKRRSVGECGVVVLPLPFDCCLALCR